MRYYGLLSLLLLLACACSDSRVGAKTWKNRQPRGWKNAYLSPPETIEKYQGRGYLMVQFVQAGGVQIQVVEKGHTYLAVGRAVLKSHDELELTCVSAQMKSRGRLKKSLEDFRKDSQLLREYVPQALAECDGKAVKVTREIDPDGTVVVQVDSVRLLDRYSERYVGLLEKLPLEGRPREMKIDGARVVEDPRNRLVPLAQAHRFYILSGERPDLKKQKGPPDQFLYDQIERGKWITATSAGEKRWQADDVIITEDQSAAFTAVKIACASPLCPSSDK